MNDAKRQAMEILEAAVKNAASEDYEYWTSEYMLDVDYVVSMDGDVKSVEVTSGTGGPHIMLDTRNSEVVGYQSGLRFTWNVSPLMCEQVVEHWEDVKQF